MNFLPQLENEPQRLNCFTIKLPIYNETTKFTFNCPLIPCKLYEISIRLLYQNQFINEFNCKRRFIRNGLVDSLVGLKFPNNIVLFNEEWKCILQN
ncbi:unnamed protein product [Schistosoma mattheei]|uniref:Uncharacterized protein n=1 Tax=Schistosoma mattheei TaxID=31246 RepID=A0A183Q1W2_9TREM|nr:unnamed protein product [Schistosoma mattheei]